MVALRPLLFGVDIPVIKTLWTTPFALAVASVATVLVFAAHRLLDGRPHLASQFFDSLPTRGAAQTLLFVAALVVWLSLAVVLHKRPTCV